MIVNVERGTPRVATRMFKADKRLHRVAQRWLASGVRTNVISGSAMETDSANLERCS